MKALSIRQPYAFAIVHGFKPVENRDWKHSFRGRVLIHAGLREEKDAVSDVLEDISDQCGRSLDYIHELYGLNRHFGAIVGAATVADVVTEMNNRWFNGPYGFVMTAPKPCTPIACKGQLRCRSSNPRPTHPTRGNPRMSEMEKLADAAMVAAQKIYADLKSRVGYIVPPEVTGDWAAIIIECLAQQKAADFYAAAASSGSAQTRTAQVSGEVMSPDLMALADKLDPRVKGLHGDRGPAIYCHRADLIAASDALRQHATALEIARGIVPFPRDELLRLIRKHFNDRSRGALIFSRWEDGIDIDQTTYAAEVLADDIARAVLASLGIKNG